MIKNIEWFRQEVLKLKSVYGDNFIEYEREDKTFDDAFTEVLDLVDEIDNRVRLMSKDWLVKEIEDASDIITVDGKEVKVIQKNHLIDLIELMDEPYIPMIPDFVAEWVEGMKKSSHYLNSTDLFPSLHTADARVKKWLRETERYDDLMLAYLFEYTIDKYTVELPNSDSEKILVMYKTVGDVVVLKEQEKEWYIKNKEISPEMFELSKKDIDGFDDKFFVFAKLIGGEK